MERKSGGDSERQRVPQPLIKKRIASGRGAMEQPNVTHDGDAALTPRFWVAIVITGVATGLFGAGLMALLQFVEKLAFSYHGGSYQAAVAATSNWHRLLYAGARRRHRCTGVVHSASLLARREVRDRRRLVEW